jgi:hypothetical protein
LGRALSEDAEQSADRKRQKRKTRTHSGERPMLFDLRHANALGRVNREHRGNEVGDVFRDERGHC